MPSRAQVAELLALGHSYEAAARELGIAPGLVQLIATGLPADGGKAVPTANPTPSYDLQRWVRERAARELT
jgi:hypothetical protein